MERLGADPAFAAVPAAAFAAELDPVHYTGRSERQVAEFVHEFLTPLLARVRSLAAAAEGAELRV
jgi:hypothetical protein